MNKIIALDTSTKKTGYAVFDLDTSALLESGVILSVGADTEERLNDMAKKICALLYDRSPAQVVFEDVKILNNQRTLVMLSEILGVIIGWCIENGKPYTALAPSVWRSAVGIQASGVKREEFKRRSIEKVKEYFNKEVMDDEADSICIGSAFLTRRKSK